MCRTGPSKTFNVHHNPNNVRIDSDPLPPPLNPNSQNIDWPLIIALFANDVTRYHEYALGSHAGANRTCIGLLFSEMASAYKNALPLLNEEDVPGASFIYAKLEKPSVDQLRRWLACHRVKTLGNKTVLLER